MASFCASPETSAGRGSKGAKQELKISPAPRPLPRPPPLGEDEAGDIGLLQPLGPGQIAQENPGKGMASQVLSWPPSSSHINQSQCDFPLSFCSVCLLTPHLEQSIHMRYIKHGCETASDDTCCAQLHIITSVIHLPLDTHPLLALQTYMPSRVSRHLS